MGATLRAGRRIGLAVMSVAFGASALGCGSARSGARTPRVAQADVPMGQTERPTAPARTAAGAIEDNSKKSASLEAAAYHDSDNVNVVTPALNGKVENVVEGASLSGSYLVDVVSAASVDILATASPRWREVRHAGSLAAEYKPRQLGVGFSASVSSEPDYFSAGAAGHLSYDLDEKNTTLFFGYGYAADDVGRGGTSFTTFERKVNRGSFLGGVNQVVDASTLASLALSVMVETGDQSKPYRYVPMFAPGTDVPKGASIDWVNAHRLFERPLEQLPLSRRRFALTAEIAHRFDASTFRATERGYYDSWGLAASTTDARWFFDAGRRVMLWPHLRFHAQKSVVFWQRAYTSDDATGWSLPLYRTGDRELGPLWSGTGGGGASFFLGTEREPRFFAIRVEGDVVYTSYLDDIYITQRTGFLGTVTFVLGEP